MLQLRRKIHVKWEPRRRKIYIQYKGEICGKEYLDGSSDIPVLQMSGSCNCKVCETLLKTNGEGVSLNLCHITFKRKHDMKWLYYVLSLVCRWWEKRNMCSTSSCEDNLKKSLRWLSLTEPKTPKIFCCLAYWNRKIETVFIFKWSHLKWICRFF